MSQAKDMGQVGRRYSQRLRAKAEYLRDRLSDLPDELAHNILSFLPTKDSVRMATLSKRWQVIWWAYPNHDFDETRYGVPYDEVNRTELIGVMSDRILSRHGVLPTVQKLRVFSAYPMDVLLESVIGNYIEHGIVHSKLQELDITFDCEYSYEDWSKSYPSAFEFPSRVFETGINLTCLKLQACNCGPCESFNLPSLKTVFFKFVTIDDKTLELLIARCPVLEELRVEFCFDVNNLRVKNTSLTTLVYASSQFLSVLQMEVPRLRHFTYSGSYLSDDKIANRYGVMYNYIKKFEGPKEAGGFEELKTVLIKNLTMSKKTTESMFSQFRQVQSLRLVGCSFEEINLTDSEKLETFDLKACKIKIEMFRVNPHILPNLRVSNLFPFANILNIETHLNECKIFPGRLFIRLAHFPKNLNVKTDNPRKSYLLYLKDMLNFFHCFDSINLNMCSFEVKLQFDTAGYMEDFRKRNYLTNLNHDCLATHLSIVKIKNFRGSPNELELVQYLLGTGTILSEVSLVFHSEVRKAEAMGIVRTVKSLPIVANSVNIHSLIPQC